MLKGSIAVRILYAASLEWIARFSSLPSYTPTAAAGRQLLPLPPWRGSVMTGISYTRRRPSSG